MNIQATESFSCTSSEIQFLSSVKTKTSSTALLNHPSVYLIQTRHNQYEIHQNCLVLSLCKHIWFGWINPQYFRFKFHLCVLFSFAAEDLLCLVISRVHCSSAIWFPAMFRSGMVQSLFELSPVVCSSSVHDLRSWSRQILVQLLWCYSNVILPPYCLKAPSDSGYISHWTF